jgi:hypothetical protein
MSCPERDKFIELLIEALQVYGNAVRATTDREGELLKRTRERAEVARQAYEDCRRALITHQLTHGCADKAMGASGSY